MKKPTTSESDFDGLGYGLKVREVGICRGLGTAKRMLTVDATATATVRRLKPPIFRGGFLFRLGALVRGCCRLFLQPFRNTQGFWSGTGSRGVPLQVSKRILV